MNNNDERDYTEEAFNATTQDDAVLPSRYIVVSTWENLFGIASCIYTTAYETYDEAEEFIFNTTTSRYSPGETFTIVRYEPVPAPF